MRHNTPIYIAFRRLLPVNHANLSKSATFNPKAQKMPRGEYLPRGPASIHAKPKRRLLHMLGSFLDMFLHLLHYPCATAHTKLGLVIVGVSAIALRAAELGTVVDHLARALRFRFD